MKLSFVVPVYNKESSIAETIGSLTNQSLKDIEIVVVDDHSTDDSLEIINYLAAKDERIKVYPLKKNMGRSYARNFGNSKVSSSIICVQDADDVSMPERAEMVAEYFKRHRSVDVVYSSFYVPAESQVIPATKFDIKKVKETKFTFIGHSTMAYRTEVVKKIQYSEGEWSKLGLDDWKIQMDMYKAGHKFGCIDKPLMAYRGTGNSISRKRNEKKVLELKERYLKSI